MKFGVLQGSILGPLHFIIYISDIIYARDTFCRIIYADDTTLSASLNYFWKENEINDSTKFINELNNILF